MFPKNGGLNLSSQDGYRFVQISPGNRAGGYELNNFGVVKCEERDNQTGQQAYRNRLLGRSSDSIATATDAARLCACWRTWESTRHAAVCPGYCSGRVLTKAQTDHQLSCRVRRIDYCRRVGDVRAARRVGRYVVGTC